MNAPSFVLRYRLRLIILPGYKPLHLFLLFWWLPCFTHTTCELFYSFSSDASLVLEARVLVTIRQEGLAGAVARQEQLWPSRHQLTLPLNGLNMLFQDVLVAVNHHNKLDADR